MRIRITREPPESYTSRRTAFGVGRVYNVDSALASALIAEGCAELDEALTPDERRDRDQRSRGEIWEVPDRKHAPRWKILNGGSDDPPDH